MIVIEAEKLAEDFRREQDAKAIIEEIVALIRKRGRAWDESILPEIGIVSPH